MIKKLALLILLLTLVGCSNRDGEEIIMICEIDHLEIIAIDGNRTATLEAVGDRLGKIDEINRLYLDQIAIPLGMHPEELLEIWEENPELIEEAFLGSVELVGSGITSEIYNITDVYFMIRVVMNFDELSPDELEYLVGERVSFVSLNEAIENIEPEGGRYLYTAVNR